MGLLNKIYGLVHAGRCLFNRLRDDRTAIGFEQSEADSRVSREFDDGEVEIVVVVHMGDILAPNRRWRGSPQSLEESLK